MSEGQTFLIGAMERIMVNIQDTRIVGTRTPNLEVTLTLDTHRTCPQVDVVTGVVTVNTTLDAEGTRNYILQVEVADRSDGSTARTSRSQVLVAVVDVNDNTPSFGATVQYPVSVAEESAAGQPVVTVRAQDADVSAPNNAIRYAFVPGGGSSASDNFTLDATTGAIATAAVLDYETGPRSYTFVVSATDGGTPARSTTVGVIVTVSDINDNSPTFTQASYVATVDENSLDGVDVLTVLAVDPDAGRNGAVSYALDDTSGMFTISGDTIQTTVNASAGRMFDYESVTQYALNIIASDNAAVPRRTTVRLIVNVIDLNDNPPVFTAANYTARIVENAPNALVTTLFTSDRDTVAVTAVRFAIETQNVPFTINASTGVLRTTTALDRELRAAYALEISATDVTRATFFDTANVAIAVVDVNDEAPIFSEDSGVYITTLNESAPVGTELLTLVARDGDEIGSANAAVSYRIVDGNDAGHFALSRTSGLITLNSPLDFENQTNFTLTVQAFDGGAPQQRTNATVIVLVSDTNDNRPRFDEDSYVVDVLENATVPTLLVQLSATDADAITGTLTFSIAVGNTSLFHMNPFSGRLALIGELDFETQQVHTLVARVTDNGTAPLFEDVSVRIQVLDVNDNNPVFGAVEYAFNAAESLPSPTALFSVAASDADSGVNGRVRYHIDPSHGYASGLPFAVNNVSGAVVKTGSIDFESGITQYVFEVVATDFGEPERSGATTVNITVLDVNDNHPHFDVTEHTFALPRSLTASTYLVTLQATDLDSGANGQVSYSVIAETVRSYFFVNSTSGDVYLVRPLCTGAVAARQELLLLASAADNGVPQLAALSSNSVRITINITDSNTQAPAFNQTHYASTVSSTTAVGTVLLQVVATDAVATPCEVSTIRYRITSGDPSSFFAVNAVSGEVTAARALLAGNYSLVVEANDGGYPDNRLATTDVVVAVYNASTIDRAVPRYFTTTGNGLLHAGDTPPANALMVRSGLTHRGDVTAHWGDLQRVQSFTVARTPAVHADIVVLDDAVWESDRRIRAILQLKDANFSSHIASAQAFVRLTPEPALVAISGRAYYEQTCTVSTSSLESYCAISMAALPSAFFTDATLNPARQYVVDVTYGVVGQTASTYGSLPLRGVPKNVTFVQNDVMLQVDAGDVYRGQAFQGTVWSTTEYDATAFTLVILTDGNVSLSSTNAVVVDSTRWSIAVSSSASRTVVSGRVQTSFTPSSSRVAPHALMTLNFIAQASATVAAPALVGMQVELLSQHVLGRVNVRGVTRNAGDPAPYASAYDRTGLRVMTGPTDGARVFVRENTVVGMLVSTQQALVVNTAVFNQVPISTQIRTSVCYRCPATGSGACEARCVAAAAPQCVATNASVLQVTATTCAAFVNGSESDGSGTDGITVTSNGLTKTQPVKVWYPRERGNGMYTRIIVEETVLEPVEGWISAADCTSNMYSSSGVTVETTFVFSKSRSDANSFDVDVTSLVLDDITVDDTAVVVIDIVRGSQAAVRGIAPGRASVVVRNAASPWALAAGGLSTAVRVISRPATVQTLGIKLATSLAVTINDTATAGTALAPLQAYTLGAQAALDVTVERADVTLVAIAILSSGHYVEVTPANGLRLSVSDANILNVTAPSALQVGVASGNVDVIADWTNPGACSVGNVSRTVQPIVVTLEEPTSLTLTISTNVVVHLLDAGAALGSIPTAATVSVTAGYDGGRTVDLTYDPRLRINVDATLLDIVPQTSTTPARLMPVSTGINGTSAVSVSFTHLNQTLTDGFSGNAAELTVTRLTTVTTTTHAYPTSAGSASTPKTQMSVIGPTTSRQQLITAMQIAFSHGRAYDVSTSPFATYDTFVTGTLTQEVEVASVARGTGGFVVSALRTGTVDLEGAYNGFSSGQRITLTVSDARTQVIGCHARLSARGFVKKSSCFATCSFFVSYKCD